MTDEEVKAPRLSDNGARVLAEVLNKRANDRHNTLVAQRNERRRKNDALRIAPPDSFELEQSTAIGADELEAFSLADPGVALELPDDDDALDLAEGDGEESSRRWMWAAGLAAAVGVCVLLASALDTLPARVDSVAPEVSTVPQEVDPPDADAEQVGEPEAVAVPTDSEPADTATDTATTETVLAESEQAEEVIAAEVLSESATSTSRVASNELTGITPRAIPGELEVLVYDTAPSANGEVYSFALRLKSIAAADDIPTEDFTIRVENEDGIPAETFTRFLHDVLPVDTSALASVRAEGAAPGEQFVTVWLDDVLLERIPIETIDP